MSYFVLPIVPKEKSTSEEML